VSYQGATIDQKDKKGKGHRGKKSMSFDEIERKISPTHRTKRTAEKKADEIRGQDHRFDSPG
jgi:hypothetical protein